MSALEMLRRRPFIAPHGGCSRVILEHDCYIEIVTTLAREEAERDERDAILRDPRKLAKYIADHIGHGMSEKCTPHAKAIVALLDGGAK